MIKNISQNSGLQCIRHSRHPFVIPAKAVVRQAHHPERKSKGNPAGVKLDCRPRLRWGQALRGSDNHFATFLQDLAKSKKQPLPEPIFKTGFLFARWLRGCFA
jgi:hypothetical protein